jgi:hypothetical protein
MYHYRLQNKLGFQKEEKMYFVLACLTAIFSPFPSTSPLHSIFSRFSQTTPSFQCAMHVDTAFVNKDLGKK